MAVFTASTIQAAQQNPIGVRLFKRVTRQRVFRPTDTVAVITYE